MGQAAGGLQSDPGKQHGMPPLRLITATSIFDGHDAAINIIRRILQDQGAEVVHLGHNRSVAEIVSAVLQEDADAVAVSSYQGGHVEFFRYLVARLRAAGAGHVQVFGGGGGTITGQEAARLEAEGVAKIYTPQDGRELSLDGMGHDLLCRTRRAVQSRQPPAAVTVENHRGIGQWLSLIECGGSGPPASTHHHQRAPLVVITGTGGAGKSSVMDELLACFLQAFPALHIAILALDPTRQKSGGALLGDRIRINNLADGRVYMRSMATRRRDSASNARLAECTDFLRSLGFGLVLVETAGTGQAEVGFAAQADLSVYVMTGDYGAPGQLEKIQMLDFADFVVLNKFDRPGAQDALRDIRKQWRRNHKTFDRPDEVLPVYPVTASHWHDAGIQALFTALRKGLASLSRRFADGASPDAVTAVSPSAQAPVLPLQRRHYLAEISAHGQACRAAIGQQVQAASRAHSYYRSLQALADPALPAPLARYPDDSLAGAGDESRRTLRRCYQQAVDLLTESSRQLLHDWPAIKAQHQAAHYHYTVRGQDVSGASFSASQSHLPIPKIALPRFADWGDLLRFLLEENLPGHYPYTAGVFPYRRATEEPVRMFAGEGTPERSNRRFHYLARGQQAKRLSTAFDPVTLYGEDVAPQPDIYGRIGMSGVSVCSLDDVKKLYSGFDLCHHDTSVSMTINGPAPVMLACFFNAAIDQQVEKHLRENGGWTQLAQRLDAGDPGASRPRYQGALPPGHDGLGLGLLGVNGERLVDPETYERIRRDTLAVVRGTLQADILKEDQAQNECLFPLEFALRMMGDVQAYFIAHEVRNYYSVSVSGYHIAEAGANPVTQLAFTLANGFTLLEYYLARGMPIDEFAPHMSFFFSSGMDPEYAVIGRVARRIWARALRHLYQAAPRSQQLKYHIQTSGRTLHARTLGYNDIRTTLQALYALYDNCNSLHTNAYDEALTTPGEASVRRALAIQMIINRELGLNRNQNPLQGAFIIEQLTDLVEAAVYEEFDRLAARGGVLGAMESLYQRGRIQDESLYYEQCKQDGSLPIVGINTFVGGEDTSPGSTPPLTRSDAAEKQARIAAVASFRQHHAARAVPALAQLQQVVLQGGNVFAELMETVKYCTLGQICHALYEVVGRYRRRL